MHNNCKLTHEIAVPKRHQFGKRSEQLAADQASLLDEAIDADLAAIEQELEQFAPSPKANPPGSPSALPCRPSCRAWNNLCPCRLSGFLPFRDNIVSR